MGADLWIGVNEGDQVIRERDFCRIINDISSLYSPIATESIRRTLRMIGIWEVGYINGRTRFDSDQWIVEIYGGIARHPEITPDGFALFLCHELGHHLGGYPKKIHEYLSPLLWQSVEGQSDYFAARECLRTYFKGKNNWAVLIKMDLPQSILRKCSDTFNDREEKGICLRISMAGLSLANTFRSVSWHFERIPRFETPERSEVSRTSEHHPSFQCRLDTFVQGALLGERPRCWFFYSETMKKETW